MAIDSFVFLVWILVVGETSGGHNGATQMGPFATQSACESVANAKPLLRFDRQCIQVKMVIR